MLFLQRLKKLSDRARGWLQLLKQDQVQSTLLRTSEEEEEAVAAIHCLGSTKTTFLLSRNTPVLRCYLHYFFHVSEDCLVVDLAVLGKMLDLVN